MPPSEGLWFFGCTDESGHKDGVVTSGGMCEIKCLPGYERLSPQLIRCERRHWEHYKLSTGDTNGKEIDPDDVKCVKIPDEELTDLDKRKMEMFEPPKQLGLPEVNELANPTNKPMTTEKTKPQTKKEEKEPEKEEPEEPKEKATTTKKTITTKATTTTQTTKEETTKATVKPGTIKQDNDPEEAVFVPPVAETTAASLLELDTTPSSVDEITKPEKKEKDDKNDAKKKSNAKGSSKKNQKKPDSAFTATVSMFILLLALL